MVIRLFRYSTISGSVPRARNKQSGVFRCGACEREGKGKTQYMGCHLAGKPTVTTRYGLRRPLRDEGIPEDPEHTFFGSQEWKREIIAA